MGIKTISIALCTYNGERFLNDQLNSFCSQSRLPDELIICDDGSQDRTVQLIHNFIKKSPFPVMFYKNERRLGYGKNFERTISLCKGDIIALSDQDDVWSHNRLARFAQIFLNDPTVGYAFCDAAVVDDKLQNLNYTLWDVYMVSKKKRKYLPGEFTKILLGKMGPIAGCLLVIQSDIIRYALPLPDLWVHDDWIPFAGSLFSSVVMIPDLLNKYRLHSQQTCGLVQKKTSRSRYLSYIKEWENAQFRIINDNNFINCSSVLPLIDAKIKHLNARGHMAGNRLKRLPAIIRELCTFRYFKYSSGIKSLARDLLLK
jgi:glycosyltransferase involved in cell wall biosynthesis